MQALARLTLLEIAFFFFFKYPDFHELWCSVIKICLFTAASQTRLHGHKSQKPDGSNVISAEVRGQGEAIFHICDNLIYMLVKLHMVQW